MKKITVIIPCHNAAKWLPKCFLSLVQQTIGIEDLELIFVDDASDDAGATWGMLQEFETAYPKSIMIIHLEENLRQGGARNVALTYASGEYVAFVDADDFVADVFLEKVYQRAIERDADIVQFEYAYYTERLGAVASGRQVKAESICISSVEERKAFLMSEKITYGCWNKLYRRALIEQAGSRYAEHVIYEEPLFVYPLLFYGNRFEIMEEPLYFYRQNEGGTMRHDMKQLETLRMHAAVQLAVWNFMKQTPFFRDYYEEIKLYFLHTYFYETLLFGVQRGFGISAELYRELRDCARQEVPDMEHSAYENLIPKQMELYRLQKNTDWKETEKELKRILNSR
jgi:glycosyltransferase involved in cell wall biosynthesis